VVTAGWSGGHHATARLDLVEGEPVKGSQEPPVERADGAVA